MLPASHYRAYQDFLTLLTKFNLFLTSSDVDLVQRDIKHGFAQLQSAFSDRVSPLTSEVLESEITSRWQSLQTEIKREFKLLSTEILF